MGKVQQGYKLFIDIFTAEGQNLSHITDRSSQMFFKIGVLKKFPIFTGRQLCWSFFLIKLQRQTPT